MTTVLTAQAELQEENVPVGGNTGLMKSGSTLTWTDPGKPERDRK